MADDVAGSHRDFVRHARADGLCNGHTSDAGGATPLRDMFDVQDLAENARAIGRIIDQRYRRYLGQQADWSSIAPTVATYELTAAERANRAGLHHWRRWPRVALHGMPEATVVRRSPGSGRWLTMRPKSPRPPLLMR